MKNRPQCGIYIIRNIKDNKIYIGSSYYCQKRFTQHKWYLKKEKHHNSYLQNVYNKYGIEIFEFTIIACVFDKNKLEKIEQEFLDEYQSYLPENGYNLSKTSIVSFGAIKPSNIKEKLMLDKSRFRFRCLQTGQIFYSYKDAARQLRINRTSIKCAIVDNKSASGYTFEIIDKENAKNNGIAIYETPPKICIPWELNQFKKGNKLSEITKKKISNATKGDRNPFYGKKHTKNAKDKMRKSWAKYKVRCIDTNEIFPSLRVASEKMQIQQQNIRNCLIGYWKQTFGHKFEKIPLD